MLKYFSGNFIENFFFFTPDAHLKWGGIFEMSQTITTKTVEVQSDTFATCGLPEQILSNNEPQFVSNGF